MEWILLPGRQIGTKTERALVSNADHDRSYYDNFEIPVFDDCQGMLIRETRKKSGYTLTAAAKRLDMAPSSLTALEIGRFKLSEKQCEELLAKFKR